MTVRIVTDSSAVLPKAWLERYRIEVVPLTISFNGESFSNGDMPYEEFARRLEETDIAPTTSAPSPGEYERAYERLLAEADALVVITPPAGLSATHRNATLAAQVVGSERVAVLDSRSAAAGEGLVALEAARAADEGADLESVVRRADAVAGRVLVYATLERLEYLKRSGRVPSVAAFATEALHLHPMFKFADGSPSPAGVVRGARRAKDKLLDAWSGSLPEAPGRTHTLVFHSSRADEAEALRQELLERDPAAETDVVQITAAMAAHIGPGMLGLAWWREEHAEEPG